jgi:hypothetical protein
VTRGFLEPLHVAAGRALGSNAMRVYRIDPQAGALSVAEQLPMGHQPNWIEITRGDLGAWAHPHRRWEAGPLFAIFAARANSIVIRLIWPPKFVDRRENSVDPQSNEFAV